MSRAWIPQLGLLCLVACADDGGVNEANTESDTSSSADTSTSTVDAETDADTETDVDTETGVATETGTDTDEPQGCVVRVKPTGDDALLGLTWIDAKATLGAALEAAEAFGEPCEVWVAAGTYKPTTGTDRTAS